jgi:acyl-CoA thioesterase
MYELDADTALTPISDMIFAADVSARWNIGAVPNGGYVLALVLAAIEKKLTHVDALSATSHYMKPTVPGAAEVHVEVIKSGRSFSTASARLIQEGTERVRVLATYGTLGVTHELRHVTGSPPRVPSAEEVPVLRPPSIAPEIAKRFEVRYAPETSGWMRGEKTGNAELRGAIRFADHRPLDVRSLALFADAFPPPIFDVIPMNWVPTLELTVHFRGKPQGDWLHSVFRTRFLFDGLLEEDGEIWDERGNLCALSRQLAVTPRG